jgi:probable rRNA maturation factor
MTRRSFAVAVQNAAADAALPTAAQIRSWAKAALGAAARGELTVRIVAAEESADLNARYRDKRGPTNVLAFPCEPLPSGADELLPLGDLVICASVVESEARAQGKALEAHWAHMVIHGILHLIGFDHEAGAEAEKMEARERELLAGLGFADPYAPRI